jgi:Immunoglobulin domain
MKKHSQFVVLTVVTGFFLFAGNAHSQDPDQPEFPKITLQPEDQAIVMGSNVTFTAAADNADGYQWMRNGKVMPGETNSTLTIDNVGKKDVGNYTLFAKKDSEAVPTRSATLNVVALSEGGGGDPFTVFGLPVVISGGSGDCPGPYIGYVSYMKPASQGWGWVPTSGATIHTATDTNRTDTKVEYVGRWGDHGCDQTSVAVPHPTFSPKYRFTIYFTNDVPTNAYPILLEGFNP